MPASGVKDQTRVSLRQFTLQVSGAFQGNSCWMFSGRLRSIFAVVSISQVRYRNRSNLFSMAVWINVKITALPVEPKESLQRAQNAINEATLKIKQTCSNSPTAKQIFFVVEGKDDIPYYGTKADEYIPNGWKVSLVPAQNRKKLSRHIAP